MDEIAGETAYQKALDYLYSFVDHSLTRGLQFSAEKFELGRMFSLLNQLGNPQTKYPVIHIAGTKGKGSTSAMIANVLKEGGYRTGLYTSPHLVEFNERIQVNGNPVSNEHLVELVDELSNLIEKSSQISTFEITTALAFLYFARQNVNIAVVEVGLGGRLDATNVVNPLISVITSLSYDHTKILGDTLAKIAGEKAGIIKPGRPVVLAPQQEEARQVVEQIALKNCSPLYQVGREILFAHWSHTPDGQTMFAWAIEDQEMVNDFIESGGLLDWEPMRLTIPLLGHHQVENAATAYTALHVARDLGLQITDDAIKNGFSGVKWPARFEIMQRKPLLIIDSAHNRDSCLRLRLALDDYFPCQPVILVFGASEDKDIDGMFAELMPRVKAVIATESAHPRALDANQIVEAAHKYGVSAIAIKPADKALEIALEKAGYEAAVVVAGSLFIASETREKWFKMNVSAQDAGYKNI